MTITYTAAAQSSGSWGVVLNGRAIHVDSSRRWNEDNWGLGIEREFQAGGRWVKLALANGFRDSMGDPSYMAGGGIKRRFALGPGDFYVDVGGVAFLMTREKVHDNRPFPGVLPAATFGFGRVAVNVTYMPAAAVHHITRSRRSDPTMDGVLFLQLKLDASLFGLGHGRAALAHNDP